jgi:hypothetical protein
MTYDDTPDMPCDKSCAEVNPKLWLEFQIAMIKYASRVPTTNWTEAEVVQWLDLELDKYIHDTLDQNFW